MALLPETIARMASLLHFELGSGLPAQEKQEYLETLTTQCAAVLQHVALLAEVDTDGVAPLYSPLEAGFAPAREDIAIVHCTPQDIMANAPDKLDTYFIVPPIL